MHRDLLPWLRLLRIGALFSPAADVVAGMAIAGLPWSMDAVRACVASVCLYAAGMVLNDHADRAVDATLRPERPIPSGRIAARHALALGGALLAAALLVSPRWPLHAVMAGLVLAYDYGSKRFVAAGVLNMAALRALNLVSGVVALTGELPANPALRTAAFAYAAYIASVTMLGVLEDQPHPSARAVRALHAVPPGAAVLALLSIPDGGLAAVLGALLGVAFLVRLRDRARVWDGVAIRRSMSWLLLGTMLWTALCCLGAGRVIECIAISSAAFVARRVSQHIAMT